MVFLVAVRAIAKNSPSQISVGQGAGRPRRARTYTAAATETKKMASSGCRMVGGCHSETNFEMNGFRAIPYA